MHYVMERLLKSIQIIKYSLSHQSQHNYFALQDKSGTFFCQLNPSVKISFINTINTSEIKHLQLGHSRNNFLFWQYSFIDDDGLSQIDNYFACIVRNDFRLLAFKENRNFCLYVINHQLRQVFKKTLHLNPLKLLFLNDQTIAIIALKNETKGDWEFTHHWNRKRTADIIVEIYNLKNKKVQQFILKKQINIDNNILNTFRNAQITPDGQLITCDQAGEIVIHKISDLSKKLKNKIESVLIENDGKPMLLPKAVVDIITNYSGLGLFHRNLNETKEIDYSEQMNNRCNITYKKSFI